jgi:hypothetical protein
MAMTRYSDTMTETETAALLAEATVLDAAYAGAAAIDAERKYAWLVEEVDRVHAMMEAGDPNAFDRLGCLIAEARGEYDPET